MPGGGLSDPDGAPVKPTLWERLQNAILKPVVAHDAAADAEPEPQSVEELRAAVKAADDRERLIGLTAAPAAAAIALITIGNELSNHKSNANVYHELLLVLLALSVGMLLAAWFRKRMILAACTALYGLAIFNLKLWGFGVPFLLVGAWLLVRSYRLQRDLKEATGEGATGGNSSNGSAPKPSKRYTPPTSRPRRSQEPDERAG